MYYTCQQKHIYYNLPPTLPFPFEVKQEYCFCVIVVLHKKTILFEKFTLVFKHKISLVENLHSKHTSTFKIRKIMILLVLHSKTSCWRLHKLS